MIQARSNSLKSEQSTPTPVPHGLSSQENISPARILELIDFLPRDLPNVFYPLHLGKFRSSVIDGTCPAPLIDAFIGMVLPHRAQNDQEHRISRACQERTERFLRSASDQGPLLARVSLLFMASYCTSQFTTSWMFKGMAIRACINAHVHRLDAILISRVCPGGCGDREVYVDPSSLEAESLRRLWWSVFNMDAFSSLLSTRPQAVDDRDLRIRLPGDDESWMTGASSPVLGEMFDPEALEEAHLRNPRPIWTRPPRVHVHSEFLPDFTTSDLHALMGMTGPGDEALSTKSYAMNLNGEGGGGEGGNSGMGINLPTDNDQIPSLILPLLFQEGGGGEGPEGTMGNVQFPPVALPVSPPSPPTEDMGIEEKFPDSDVTQPRESAFSFYSRLCAISNRIGVYARRVYGGRRVTPPDLPHSEFSMLHASLARWLYSLPEDAFTTQGPTTFPPLYPLGLLHLSILILHKTRLQKRRTDPMRATTPTELHSMRMVRRAAHTLTSLLSLPSLVPFPLTFPKVNTPCSEHAGFTRPWPFLSNVSYYSAIIHSDTLMSPYASATEKQEAYQAFVTCRRVMTQAACRSPPSRFHAELLGGLEARLTSSLPPSSPYTFPVPMSVDALDGVGSLLPLELTAANVASLNDIFGEDLWKEGQQPFFNRGPPLDHLHALLRLPPDLL